VIRGGFTWKQVAQRLRSAVADVRAAPAARLPRLGWVSPWNSREPFAEVSRALASGVPDGYLRVLAARDASPVASDEAFVRRCWDARGPLDELCGAIAAGGIDALVVHFHPRLIDLSSLGQLVERTTQAGTAVYVVVHGPIEDADAGPPSAAAAALERARRLLVNSVEDLNRLRELGLLDQATLLPFGARWGSDRRASLRLYSMIRGELSDECRQPSGAPR
jgi:hypothetical protein